MNRLINGIGSGSVISSVAIALLYPSFAFASSEDNAGSGGGLSEIVVTATRRSENVQNVPISITAVSAEELQRRGVTETSDLMGSIPNLHIGGYTGKSQPSFTLRGVGVGNEANANAASAVGVYVDEVYQSFRPSHGGQLYDLERVEVLRGPQGTLYGRNTTGGAINFITRKPGLDGTNGYLTIGYGNYNEVKIEGAIEATLVPDKLGVRFAGTRVTADGWLKNRNPEGIGRTTKDFGSTNNWSNRLTLRFKPTDTLDITLKGYMSDDDPTATPPLALGIPGLVPEGTDNILGYSRAANGLKNDEIQSYYADRFTTKTAGVVLNVTAELSDSLSLVSVSGWDKAHHYFDWDCSISTEPLCEVYYDTKSKSWNQDVRLSYDNGNNFRFILGGYYGKDTQDVFNHYNVLEFLQGLQPEGYFNPVVDAFFYDPEQDPSYLLADNTYRQKRSSYAAYLEATYDFTPELSLTGGVRYTHDKIGLYDVKSLWYDNTGALVASVIPVSMPYDPTLPGVTDTHSGGKMTGRAILKYKPNRDIMVYASYSHGYRSGAYNGQSYTSVSQIEFVKPEELDAYEVGFKSRFFNGRLQVNGAAFYYDYKNQQVSEVVGVSLFLRNFQGSMKGGELEVEAALTDRLHLQTSLGVLDSSYTKTVGGEPQTTGGISIGGNNFPFAPGVTFNTGLDWTAYQSSNLELKLRGDVQYIGKIYFDARNDTNNFSGGNLLQKGYWLQNARADLKIGDAITVSGWVKNISNKLYYTYGLSIADLGYNHLRRSVPRTYGIEATYRF